MAMFEKIITITWTKIISKMKKRSVWPVVEMFWLSNFSLRYLEDSVTFIKVSKYIRNVHSPSAIDSIAIRSKSNW